MSTVDGLLQGLGARIIMLALRMLIRLMERTLPAVVLVYSPGSAAAVVGLVWGSQRLCSR